MEQTDINTLEDEDRLYKAAKLINIQAARTWFKTRPSLWKGHTTQAVLQELGLFLPYSQYKERKEFFEWVHDITNTNAKKSDNRGPRGPRGPRAPSFRR